MCMLTRYCDNIKQRRWFLSGRAEFKYITTSLRDWSLAPDVWCHDSIGWSLCSLAGYSWASRGSTIGLSHCNRRSLHHKLNTWPSRKPSNYEKETLFCCCCCKRTWWWGMHWKDLLAHSCVSFIPVQLSIAMPHISRIRAMTAQQMQTYMR